MYKDTTYNGWKNRATWNVSLWLNNDEYMYKAAVEFVRLDTRGIGLYYRFIQHIGLGRCRTPDGFLWDGAHLDYKALNDMMRDLIPCSHENPEWYTDGNEGGFTKFIAICPKCKHYLTKDEMESR
jgi:hypothetical protein